MSPVLITALNVVFATTVWLALPIVFRIVLGNRAPELQRAWVRCALIGLPLVFVLTIFIRAETPLVEWSTDAERLTKVAESVPASEEVWVTAEGLATWSSLPTEGFTQSRVFVPEGEDLAALDDRQHDQPPRNLWALVWSPSVAMGLWALVTLGLLLRWVGAYRAYRRIRATWSLVGETATGHLHRLARERGYKRTLTLLSSDRGAEAIASGVRRPAVTVPHTWLGRLPSGDTDPVLLHEIGHHYARDPLWRLLWALATSILWLHPLVSWLAARDRHLSELAADRFVLRAGCNPRDYARMVGQLLAEHLALEQFPATSGFFGTRKNLEGRIRMILSTSPGRRRPLWVPAVLLSVASMVLIVGHPLVGLADDPALPGVTVEDGWWVLEDSDAAWKTRVAPTRSGGLVEIKQKEGTVHIAIGSTVHVFDSASGEPIARHRKVEASVEVEDVRAESAPRAEPNPFKEPRGISASRKAYDRVLERALENLERGETESAYEALRHSLVFSGESKDPAAGSQESLIEMVARMRVDRQQLLERVERLEKRFEKGNEVEPPSVNVNTARPEIVARALDSYRHAVESVNPKLAEEAEVARQLTADLEVYRSHFAETEAALQTELARKQVLIRDLSTQLKEVQEELDALKVKFYEKRGEK